MGTVIGRVAKFGLLMVVILLGGLTLPLLPAFVFCLVTNCQPGMPSPWKEVVILGIVGTALSSVVAIISRWGDKRRKAEELKRIEGVRRREEEQRTEEKRKLGEAKRLEAKRQAEEAARLQEERKRREQEKREQSRAEETKKRNEEEEKRLREERKHKQAEELMQHRKPGLMAMIVMQHERAQQETEPDVRSWLMENLQDLQQQLGDTGALAEELIGELAEIVRTAFLVKSCPRCHENKMALIEVSPNAKSIEHACVHCGRRQRAAATSPDAVRAKTLEKFIVAVLGKAWFKTLRHGYRCTFLTPEATLPYERPTRELIPEAMRAQVWRRDDGRCVQCGSRENLHIDHIVPVSKGGATSVPNLQVLCQSCNLSKGAKI